jgi:multiple sugar transport system substrate-binding protein
MAGKQTTVTRRAVARSLAGLAMAAPAVFSSRARAQPITLKMWMHLHPPRLAVDKQIIAAFEKANPDVKVDYQVFPPSDYATKLLTAFAAGAGPDFFNWSSNFMAQWHHYGVIAPIEYAAMGYANEKALTGQYLNGFAAARFGDKLYGVPSEFSNWACYTNNAIWQGARVDPMKDFPGTWEDLPKLAEKLTVRDKAGVPVRRGFDFDWSNSNIFYAMMSTMMHQRGVSLVDEQKNEANLNTPAAREVMQYYADWVNKWKLGGPQYIESRIAFLNGKMGSEGSFGIWAIPQMKQAKIDFSVRPAPRWAHGVNEGFDAYAFYMMANARSPSPVQTAAWKMARAYVDHAPQLYEVAGLFVPRQDVRESAAFKSNPWPSVFMDELKVAKFSPRIVPFERVLAALAAGRDQVLLGQQPVGSVLADLNNQVNQILKAGA